MTEPSALSALINQREFVAAATTLVQHIEASVPLDASRSFWQGQASGQYQFALEVFHDSVAQTRVWLEQACTHSQTAIAWMQDA